jgi:hypothetical protein
MPQVVIAIGFDAQDNPVNLYTGLDYQLAKSALDDAGTAGSVNIGYILKNPPAELVLRYGPGVTEPAKASS